MYEEQKEYLTRSLPYELISLSICTIADVSSALDHDHQILYYEFRFRYHLRSVVFEIIWIENLSICCKAKDKV